MSQIVPPQEFALFKQLKLTILEIQKEQLKNQQERRDDQMVQTITTDKLKQNHKIQVQALRQELSIKSSLLEIAMKKLEDQQRQNLYNYKRQFKRLQDGLGEKQNEIQALNKQVNRLKNRLSATQSQLSEMTATKQSIQHTAQKAIQLLKAHIKQLTIKNSETQLGHFMDENNYRHTNDRLQKSIFILADVQNKKKYNEISYQKLNKVYKELNQENIQLQVEIQRLKNANFQLRNNQQMNQFESNSNGELVQNHGWKKQNDEQLIKQLQETLDTLNSQNSLRKQLQEKIDNLCVKFEQENQIFTEIIIVKQQNKALKDQLNDLKQKFNPYHAEQLLKKQRPTLYDFFAQKMTQIQNFEKRLNKIQFDSAQIMQMLEKIVTEGVPQKKIDTNQQQLAQRQKAIRSKIKKQMIQGFQEQKKRVKEQSQNFYREQIQFLKIQVTQLYQKSEDCYKIIEEMNQNQRNREENKALEPINQISQKMQIETILTQTNQLTNQNLAQLNNNNKKESKKDSERQHELLKSNKQLIQYLQLKTQRLENQNETIKKKIQLYKKQLRKVLENYRIKNVKLKIMRCNQCFLEIQDGNDQQFQRCLKCRLELHSGQCYRSHIQGCKVTKFRNKSNPKASVSNPKGISNNKHSVSNPKNKKTSSKLTNQQNSQQLDYF